MEYSADNIITLKNSILQSIQNDIKLIEEKLHTMQITDTEKQIIMDKNRAKLQSKSEFNYKVALQKALDAGDAEGVLRIVRKFVKQKKADNTKYLEDAREYRKLILRKRENEKYKDCLKELFLLRNIDEFESPEYSDVYHLKFPIMQAASLRQQFVRRRRMKQIGKLPDRWLTYNKQYGEEFAEMVGVHCPKTERGFTIDQIPCRNDIVIKPLQGSGSKGVYIVRNEYDIYSVSEATSLHSWEELRQQLQNELDTGKIKDNSFEVQEAIYNDATEKTAAHDLKFYAFYGEIAAILEIVRLPEKGYWWWKPDGTLIDIGETMPNQIEPVGFTPEMLEIARQLSLKIPSPYLRLDFLRSGCHLYFDEFCTMSGGQGAKVLEQHFPLWDRKFGNEYLKAEMRILNDLLAGKCFDELNEFNRMCDERARK